MIEIPITSAFQFFKLAYDRTKDRNHVSELEFYRGHSNKEWMMIPTICRNNMLIFEENLIDEFLRRRPNEFSENEGLFNTIAKMQHYGLHTRLLDITENPAVALYFACCDNPEADGEIFIIQRSLDEVENNTVTNIITEFYIRFQNHGGNYDIEFYYDYLQGKYNKRDIDTAMYYIINGYSCICRPKIIAERILRQAGSFMMLTNKVVIRKDCREDKEIMKKINRIQEFRGIDESNIKYTKYLSITHSVNDYKEAHIKNEQNGYRYIVKAESKKEILAQLKTIGITKTFVFPELSNEGSDVMEEYLSRASH